MFNQLNNKIMTKTKIWMLAILVISFFVVSCDKDDDPINESKVLIEYLESVNSPLGKDYVNIDMPAIMSATDVKSLNETGQVYIIDIRSAVDFADGHIDNAVNVAAGDILTHVESMDFTAYTRVAVVCYTGQSAAWTTCLLRLMGHEKVYSMAWGMSSWHSKFNKWTSNTGNTYATEFTSTATDMGGLGDLPALSTTATTGQEILEARVDDILAEGFGLAAITNTEVFGNLENYYIVNYWPENHYDNPGHIPGAMQYTPKASMKLLADLKTLPTDKTIVVYCYTGQNSANLAAYLRLVGYDAKSLKFGVNGMAYNAMIDAGITSVFNESKIMGYDFVQ